MKENFEQALKYVLRDEGGNSDDPQDHGGRTSRGVTQREYNSWCRLNSKPQGDVWSASDDDIHAIYLEQYWNPYCDSLPSGVDYLFFDISVNAGRTQAVRTFQKALGVKVDGMLGVNTRDALENVSDVPELIKAVTQRRRDFYRSLSQFYRYGKGWLARTDRAETNALAMFDNRESPFIAPQPAPIKASRDTPAESTVSPQTSGGVAASTGTLAAMLNQFKEDLSPYHTELKYLTYALVGIAIVAFLNALWSSYKQNKIQRNI